MWVRLIGVVLAGLSALVPGMARAQQRPVEPVFVAPPPPPAPALVTPPTPGNDPSGWFTADDYPVLSTFAEEEGTVGFTVTTDPTGMVVDCIVTSTSGFGNLDTATCALMRARGRFNPARDSAGRAVRGRWSSRFHWVLPEPEPMERTSWAVQLQFTLDATGNVTKCEEAAFGIDIKDTQMMCPVLRATPPAELMGLRGTATGPVSMIVQSESLINRSSLPPLPALPTSGFKPVGAYRLTFDVPESGRPENCAGDMLPYLVCANFYPYVAAPDRRSVMWRITILTTGDPAVTDATDRFFR